MADAPSAEDAAAELGDRDSRLVRERHRRQDVVLFKTSLVSVQEAAPSAGKAALETARQHPLRRNCHAHPRHLPRRLAVSADRPRPYHCHRRRPEEDLPPSRALDGQCTESKADASFLLSSTHSSPVSFGDDDEHEDDADDADDGDGEDDDDEEEHEEEEEEEEEEKEHRVAVAEEYRVGAPRIVVAASLVEDESSSSNGDGGGADGAGMIGNATRAADAASADARRSSRPASGVLFPLAQTNALNISSRLPGVNDRQSNHDSATAVAVAGAGKAKSRGGSGDGVSKSAANLASEGQQSYSATTLASILAREIEAEAANDKSVGTSGSDNITSDIGATSALGGSIVSAATSAASGGPAASIANSSSSSSNSLVVPASKGGAAGAPSAILASGVVAGAAANGCTALDSSDTVVATLLSLPVAAPISIGMAAAAEPMVLVAPGPGGILAARQQQQGTSPFKAQVRTAEDTLDGPCGKKRCADRYDSSESSDSGVAISCGECSSSGTSDITEPGSPCSTSSDEGVAAVRGASASPLLCLPKLAPCSQIGTRPQWPWTPPLAATACSTYKRHKGEPEAGALPRSGAADPTSRVTAKPTTKSNHHHETQGKITEYFKTQIKPQQPKIKKTSESMSVLVAKNTTEFRRPPTVQRNKGGLAKYLGSVSTTGRGTPTSNWASRTLSMSPPPTKKTPPVVVPRLNGKLEKKLPKPLPGLPISNDVLMNLPGCKISSIRLTSESTANMKSVTTSPATGTTVQTVHESVTLDFKGCILSKPHVNENNNLMNGSILSSSRSQTGHDPLSWLSVPEESKSKESQASPPEEDEEEEEDSRSSGSKASLSPILSAPTTIRFPARKPEKDRRQGTDSGVCRWDKCGASFECSSSLLEHLQVAHINTQTGGDNFVCHWQGCKVQGRSSCSRRWLERHVLSHGGNKPFRCIVDGCGSRFSSQTALERHVNSHFNQPETSSSSGRRSCENGGKLVRRNGKRLRYRRQPWSARLFDYFDSGVMEGLQHRLLELAKSRTQGQLAETPGNSMALTSQVLARRVEIDGKTKVLLRWHPQDIEPDEWVLESEVQNTKYVGIREVAAARPEEVSLALYPAVRGGDPPLARVKQRRKSVKNS